MPQAYKCCLLSTTKELSGPSDRMALKNFQTLEESQGREVPATKEVSSHQPASANAKLDRVI